METAKKSLLNHSELNNCFTCCLSPFRPLALQDRGSCAGKPCCLSWLVKTI